MCLPSAFLSRSFSLFPIFNRKNPFFLFNIQICKVIWDIFRSNFLSLKIFFGAVFVLLNTTSLANVNRSCGWFSEIVAPSNNLKARTLSGNFIFWFSIKWFFKFNNIIVHWNITMPFQMTKFQKYIYIYICIFDIFWFKVQHLIFLIINLNHFQYKVQH